LALLVTCDNLADHVDAQHQHTPRYVLPDCQVVRTQRGNDLIEQMSWPNWGASGIFRELLMLEVDAGAINSR